MRAFLFFEVTVALLCAAVVLSLSKNTLLSNAAAIHHGRHGLATTPDAHLALFWLHRSLTTPYRAWYLHDTDAYATAPLQGRLPHSAVEQGRVLLPLHVIYLRLCGQWLRWARPELTSSLRQLTGDELSSSSSGLTSQPAVTLFSALQEAVATVAACCVTLIGAPASWYFAETLARLLTRAVRERVRVARMQLPPSSEEAHLAAAAAAAEQNEFFTANLTRSTDKAAPHPTASTHATTAAEPKTSEVATPHNVHNATVFLGALLVVVMGLLPLLVVEVGTLQPWCLVGSLLVWAVGAVLQDAQTLHTSETDMPDDAFDLSAPIVEEGPIVFYSAKQQPSLVPLVCYTVIATCMALTLHSCLHVVPLFLLWALTSCWQHGYKRVLVKMKEKASGLAAHGDHCTRVGYSCYADKLHMNECFCYVSVASVTTVLLLTTPWWWLKQPLLTFMDLFVSPKLPGNATADAATLAVLHARSFTGARELHANCLSGLTPYYTCARPTANGWRLSEWFGLPWTRVAKSLTGLFFAHDDDVDRESARWLDFPTLVLAVLANAPSVLVIAFYRVRKPPLSFETPLQYATERAAQQAEQQAYWEKKRQARSGGGAHPTPTASSSSASSSAVQERKRAKVVTCLCREEYLAKQVVLFCWMLSLAVTSGTLLFVHNGPASGVLALTCGALLAAVYAIVWVLRRAHRLAFAAWPSTTTPAAAAPRLNRETMNRTSTSAEAQQPRQTEDAKDPSALTQQGCDDPRPPAASRWCTSAVAPSLAHAADVAWLLLLLLASVLSTGALTWAVVPPLARQGALVVVGGGVGVALHRLRQWAQVDFTSSVLFTCGCAASLLLALILLLQLFSSTTMSTARSVFRLTSKFGDLHSRTGDVALRTLVYQCAVAYAAYVGCVVYASLRIGRLALEPEEVSLVPIESELSFFNKPTQTKKNQ